MARRGKLIVIEGNRSSGKGVQMSLLAQRLRSLGQPCEVIRFPRYDSPTGKLVGGPYLGKKGFGKSLFPGGDYSVDPIISSLYYAADRRAHLQHIVKALSSGTHVIIGRYTSSNMAHQGVKIKSPWERKKFFNSIFELEHNILRMPRPDVTIYLHVPSRIVYEMHKSKEGVGKEDKEREHIMLVEEMYLELATKYTWKYVSCAPQGELLSDEQIHQRVFERIENVLLKKG